jgi:hypothetical protein
MEFGCLQDIVVKLIIFKSAMYEIIWSEISYYLKKNLFVTLESMTYVKPGAKASFISIITFELIVVPCDLCLVIAYANVIGNDVS